ncbi:MAG: FAD-dependent oxidoreductase [Gaiellales bacterium]
MIGGSYLEPVLSFLPPTVTPGLAPPWWLDEALAAEGGSDEERAAEAPTLEGELAVDVAVIGGGYTGLWTALALREREPSLSIAVLEQEIVGWGPSGRNGGFVHGFWTQLASLREMLGDADALRLARAGSGIIPAIRTLCERRGADVWLREGGYLKVSAAAAQDAGLERLLTAMRELGVEDQAVPLSREEVAERVRSARFRHGVWLPECATVQPARLARALRSAALADGIAVHERTRVVKLEQGDPNVLETPAGRVRARDVVVATNAWMTGWGPVKRYLTNFGSYVVLTEPVPELLELIGWTGDEAISDGRMFIHYFRTTNDGRVLMGSGSGPIGFGGAVDCRFTADVPTAARAELGLRKLLPGLAPARVTHAWGGPIDVSSDHQPFYGTVPGARIHYGVGYSGHGVGPAWVGGQILASLVLRADDEWTSLPLVTRKVPKLPPEPIRGVGGALVRAAILACEEREEDGLRVPVAARAVASLPRLFGLRIGTR